MTLGTSIRAALLLGAMAFAGAGCGGDKPAGDGGGEKPGIPAESEPSGATAEQPAEPGAPAEPIAPAQSDPDFDPSEWTTAKPTPLGDPRARRDIKRPFVVRWSRFPPTLRTEGPNANLTEQREMRILIYESMIGIDSETEEFVPGLASHWKIETDLEKGNQTFTYRIDERARFADGAPVTANDVYHSWKHLVQEDRQDPMNLMVYNENFEEPVVVDRLTIKVTTTELNWRLFSFFGGMFIYKADEVQIPGDKYLEEYNWKWFTGTGPYVMTDLKKGESITLTRRDDWWGDALPENAHLYNFHQIKYLNLREQEIVYEKFKKGELDWYQVGRAQRWVEEIPREDLIKKGWVKRRKIYNKQPQGYFGLCFNMRKPPFDDRRVRLAFAHLFNREQLMERLFFNQYEFMNSYFPGRDWGAGDENELVHFDPDRATELLAEAGYKERDANGFLVGPGGSRLEMTLYYAAPSWERIWLVVQEGYQDAGVNLKLELIDGATLVKKITDRQFTIHSQSFSSLLFPNPETTWRSDLADKKNNNNIPGFKSAEVDALLEKYNDVELTRAQQKELTREIDRLVFNEHPYALAWYGPYERILYWHHMGHPDRYLTRIEQFPHRDMIATWWFDPAKEAELKAAQASGKSLPQGEVEVRPWDK